MTVRTRLQLHCEKTSVLKQTLDRMLGWPAVESNWERKPEYLDFILFFLDLHQNVAASCMFLILHLV